MINILFHIYKDLDIWSYYLKRLKVNYERVNIVVTDNLDSIDLDKFEVIVATRFSQNQFTRAKKLKAFFTPKSGLDKIDISEEQKRTILLRNSHANSEYVAERALALALCLLGRIVEFDNDLRVGNWFSNKDCNKWQSISDLTCGILGFGHIGKKVYKLLEAFGVKTFVYSRHQNCNDIDYTSSIEELCMKTDLLFVCLPLTSHTKNIIDDKCISALKGGFIVNVSRGEIIDESLLYSSLVNNHLRGAALDVWYNYPDKVLKNNCMPSVFPFQDLDNIIMSPHAGSHAFNAKENLIKDVFTSIESYLNTTQSNIYN